MIGLDIMMAYTPNVAPTIMERVTHVESRGGPLALNVNVKQVIERDEKGWPTMVTGKNGQPRPRRRKVVFKRPIKVETKQDVVTAAYAVMASGLIVNMSYMQANSSNLLALGFTVEDMFDSCKNLAAGANALSISYTRTLKEYLDPQTASRVTLSAYNTDDSNKGYLSGYLVHYRIGNPAMSVSAINSYMAGTTVFAY